MQLTDAPALGGFNKLLERVRFPLALPTSLKCREISRDCSENRAKWPQFRIVWPLNRTGESVPHNAKGEFCGAFSGGRWAVPFQRLQQANALRSEIDDVAKPALTFVCLQAFISINLRKRPRCRLRDRMTSDLPVIRPESTLPPTHTNLFSTNSNDVSFELLRRSEQPTAVVHETICEQAH
jgi:hypothetical protein